MDARLDSICQTYDKRISDLRKSLEYTQAFVDDIQRKMNQNEQTNKLLNEDVQTLMRENANLKLQLKKMEDRVDYLDDQGRRNNIRISGVPEERGENWEMCQRKITKIIEEKLQLKPALERAHRIGKYSPQQTHPRDILAHFPSQPVRDAVYRKKKNMQGTQIYLNEDFCPGTVAVRRQQLDKLYAARREGKFAYFNYRQLVVREFRNAESSGGGRRPEGQASQPRLTTHHTPPRSTPPSSTRLPRPTSPRTPPPRTSSREMFPDLTRSSPNSPILQAVSTTAETTTEAHPCVNESATAASRNTGVRPKEGCRDEGATALDVGHSQSQRVRRKPDMYQA